MTPAQLWTPRGSISRHCFLSALGAHSRVFSLGVIGAVTCVMPPSAWDCHILEDRCQPSPKTIGSRPRPGRTSTRPSRLEKGARGYKQLTASTLDSLSSFTNLGETIAQPSIYPDTTDLRVPTNQPRARDSSPAISEPTYGRHRPQ